MNQYHSILVKEAGQDGAKQAMKWARRAIRISNNGCTAKGDEQFKAQWDREYSINSHRNYLRMLAVTALMRRTNKDLLSVNARDFLGTMFSFSSLLPLAQDGLIEIHRTVLPGSIVFLRN